MQFVEYERDLSPLCRYNLISLVSAMQPKCVRRYVSSVVTVLVSVTVDFGVLFTFYSVLPVWERENGTKLGRENID